jgi:methyl-accepting chemotaxis protein
MKKLFNIFNKEDKDSSKLKENMSSQDQSEQDDFLRPEHEEKEELHHENSLLNLTNSDWDNDSNFHSVDSFDPSIDESIHKNNTNINETHDDSKIMNYSELRKQEQKHVLDSHDNLLNGFRPEENKDNIMTKKTKGEKKGFLSFLGKGKKENEKKFDSSPSEADFLNEEDSDKLNTIGLSESDNTLSIDSESNKTEFSDFSLDSTTQTHTQEHSQSTEHNNNGSSISSSSFSELYGNAENTDVHASNNEHNKKSTYSMFEEVEQEDSFGHSNKDNKEEIHSFSFNEKPSTESNLNLDDFSHVQENSKQHSYQDLDSSDTLDFAHNDTHHSTHHDSNEFEDIDSTTMMDDELDVPSKKSKVSSINDLIKNKDNSKKAKRGIGYKLNSITQAFTNNKKKLENNSITSSLGSGAFSINSIESRQKRVWVIGNLPVRTQYTITAGGVVVGVALLLASALLYNNTKNAVLFGKETAISLNANTQKFASAYGSLLQGGQITNPNGNNNNLTLISNINKLDKTIDNEINSLNEVNNKLGADSLHGQSQIIAQKWEGIKANTINSLNNHQNAQLLNYLETSNQKIADLNNYFGQITAYTQQLNNALAQEGNSNAQNNLYAFTLTSQNVNSSLMNVLNSQSYSVNNLDVLKQSRALARDNLASVRWNNKLSPNTTNIYEALANNWIKYANLVDASINYMPSVLDLKQKFATTNASLDNIEQATNQLSNAYTTSGYTGYAISYFLVFIGLIIALISVIYTVYIYLFEQGNKSLIDKIENNKNQSAILRLLDEMTPLSSGDLTKMTTVTEEITGVIADSINLTINDLANLVKKIKESVGVMRQKTHEASTISSKMLLDGLEQAKNITSTGNDILSITQAINEISKRTSESAKEARESATIAKTGENFVQASVESMHTIKENMDSTVKLMLRLDNSSKQISEIVELLSDITEETSVLAVNATLQAVKAGEAGKGFKVVADSVKNLATKAAEATRRVGLLINETQTYITDVVDAVSKTNKEVEKGTKLSSDAGRALVEITTSSDALSKVIDEISKETKRNADITSNISKNITTILEVTEAAGESNKSTAKSINEIANISDELESSVKQFKVED